MKTVNVGVIGLAHFHGYSYARAVTELPNAKIVAISDDDEERGRKAAEQYSVEYYRDYNELLRRGDVDAVIVTAENVKHAQIVIAAAEAGKHILCEKPIATTLQDADAMVKAADTAKVKFQTAFPMRYHQAAAMIKGVIDRKEIGKVVAITATNHLKWLVYGWFIDPKLSGGGAVMDHTVHNADLMRWYTKSEAKTVYTEIGKNIHSEVNVEDNALTMVTFRNGAFGTIDGSWSRPASFYTWGDVTLEILGTEGFIQLDVFRQNVNVVEADSPNNRLEWHYWGCDADMLMVKSFIECIEKDKKPLASGFDGRQATEITVAAYESARKGEPVSLPLH
ncbi:MAG: Gfo/Idh/MocA family oxidoreductase [Candidatus Bathyarchaeia archaeon]